MNQSNINSLLRDAEILGQRAAKEGTLPEDCRIFDEIAKLANCQRQGHECDLGPLLLEMNRVVKASKIIVDQLTFRHRVLSMFRRMAARIMPLVIWLTAILVTMYLIYQSSELRKADMALREYQDFQEERLPEKIYLAWKMYYYEDVLKVTGPPLSHLDGYQKLIEDAKRLSDKRQAIHSLFSEAARINFIPTQFENIGPMPLRHIATALNNSFLQQSNQDKGNELKFNKAEIDCSKLSLIAAKEKLQVGSHNRFSQDEKLHAYIQSKSCFLKTVEIDENAFPLSAFIYPTRSKVDLLVSWLLPGIYGLLGACVFLMRELLAIDEKSTPGTEVRLLKSLNLLLRLALGGLAGIIVGWFTVPTSASSAASSVLSSSVIPFGIAFLAGFSIKSLFDRLDRLVRTSDNKPAEK